MITPVSHGTVRGFLHRATGELRDGLVLTHGAGGNAEMPLLVTVAEAFAAAGICVLRVHLPFRQKRPHGAPGRGDAARDQDGLKDAAAVMRGLVPGRIFLGGQSYGGRQASLLAAVEPNLANGLVLLSYPLHPPGKPEQLRTAHFPSLKVPVLFVHGTRDPFATSEELLTAVTAIPAHHEIVELTGAGHELARGRFDAAEKVLSPFLRLVPAAAAR